MKQCIYVYTYTHWPLSLVPGLSKVALINWPVGMYFVISASATVEDSRTQHLPFTDPTINMFVVGLLF